MKSWIALLVCGVLLVPGSNPVQAASALATPEQDRYAKQAVPPSGKALIYVYRLNDASPQTSPVLWLNTRQSGHLETQTYGMWAAGAGRLEVRAGRADAVPLVIACETGRIYFVQLVVNADGSMSLRQVPYGNGRTDLQSARLVLDPAIAARAAAVPKPAEPAAEPTPARAAAAPKAAPVPKPDVPASGEERDSATEQGASGFTLIAKVGSFQLASESQVILGLNRSFSDASVAYGMEGEWRLENGFAFGLEVFGHAQDYTTTASAQSGDMAVTSVFINAKKYFRPAALVQPYIGIGIGSAAASFSAGSSGGITGSAGGFAVQGMTGIALRWQRVGIYTELKYAQADVEDAAGQSVDASGIGLFAGMSVHF